MTGTLKTALVAMLVIVLALAGATAYFMLTNTAFPWQSTEAPTRLLLIAGSQDDTGAVVAQVIALVDTQAGTVTAIAPETPATISGTNYSQLKDAFPFGGGAAVAQTYANASNTAQLSFIAVSPAELLQAIDGLATVEVTLPASMDVFDGDVLHTFTKGAQTVSAIQFAAIVKGRPYLTSRERADLDQSLAEALTHIVGVWPGGLQQAVTDGAVTTDMLTQAIGTLEPQLAGVVR